MKNNIFIFIVLFLICCCKYIFAQEIITLEKEQYQVSKSEQYYFESRDSVIQYSSTKINSSKCSINDQNIIGDGNIIGRWVMIDRLAARFRLNNTIPSNSVILDAYYKLKGLEYIDPSVMLSSFSGDDFDPETLFKKIGKESNYILEDSLKGDAYGRDLIIRVDGLKEEIQQKVNNGNTSWFITLGCKLYDDSYDIKTALSEGRFYETSNLTLDLVVKYVVIHSITISNSFGGGSIKINNKVVPSGSTESYEKGTLISLEAFNQEYNGSEYIFQNKWKKNGIEYSSENPLQIIVEEDASFEAIFKKKVVVSVDQIRENGDRIIGSKIGRWVNNSFETLEIPSIYFSFEGATEVLRGSQELIHNPIEKYNSWKDYNDVKNHQAFVLTHDSVKFVSKFKKVYDSVVIQSVSLYGQPYIQTIQFKDPWLIDYADPEYGNAMRNRGMSAPFKTVPSPFQPTLQSQYKGVFLNQSYTGDNPVYYSVRAIEPQQAEVHGEQVDFYFQRWGGTGVQYKSPGSPETPVVFTQAGAVAEAVYKGHLVSNLDNPTKGNASRQIAKIRPKSSTEDITGMVYIDDNTVWYSENNGQGWSKEQSVCTGENYILTHTTIASDGAGNYAILVVGHVTSNPNQKDIAVYDYKVGSPLKVYSLSLQTDEIIEPVLYYGKSRNSKHWVALWDNGDGIALWKSGDSQYSLVPGTGSASGSPAIGGIEDTYVDKLMIVWSSGNDIYGLTCDMSQLSSLSSNNVENLTSSYTTMRSFDRPIVVCLSKSSFLISWDAQVPDYQPAMAKGTSLPKPKYVRRVFVQHKTSSGSTLYRFNYNGESQNSSIGLQQGSVGANKVVLVWEETGQGIGYSVGDVSTSLLWSAPELLVNHAQANGPKVTEKGYQPQLLYSVYESPSLLKTLPVQVNGTLNKSGSSLAKGEGSQSVSSYRSGISVIRSPHSEDMPDFYYAAMYAPVLKDGIEHHEVGFSEDSDHFLQSEEFAVESGQELELKVDVWITNTERMNPESKLLDIYLIGSGDERILIDELRLGDLTTMEESALYAPRELTYSLPEGRYRLEIDMNRGNGLFSYPYYMTVLIPEDDNHSGSSLSKGSNPVKIIPEEYRLYQNYPNPFNPTTTIGFDLPVDEHVRLSVYDLRGREVLELMNKRMSAGSHKVVFDGSELASGIYFYRLQAGHYISHKKMLLVK